jgi:hypothetical protein
MVMAGEEERRGALEAAALSNLAVRLRKYFATVAAAYSFFFYGTVMASYWLAVAAISLLAEAGDNPVFWISATAATIPVIVLAGLLSGAAGPKAGSRTWRRKGRLAGLIYMLTFALAFPTAGALHPALASVAWYPALAVAHLLVHLSIEREAYRRGEMITRPFLVCGFSALATTPLVVLAALRNLVAGWMLALSLMLASYSAAAFVALKGASRAFETRGEREGGELRGSPEGG